MGSRRLGWQGTWAAVMMSTALAVSPPSAAAGDGFCQSCGESEAAAPPAPEFGGCLCSRSKLTGDWGGCRNTAALNGVTYDFDETLFYYGVTSGGLDEGSAFGGHGDYVVNFNFTELGGPQGLFLKLRAEHRYGDTVNGQTGAVLPATISPALPVADSNDFYLTNVLFTQALSEEFAVFAGKLDTFDGDANAFAHGRGKTQFSNMALVVNPTLLRLAPYSTLGAGFVVLEEMQPVFSFNVLSPTDTTKTSGFDELFAEGVVLNAELRLPTCWFEMPGHQLLGAVWSSREFFEIGQDPRFVLPNVPVARHDGGWGLYWNFDQYLVVYDDQPLRGWGPFGRVGLSQDEVNPIEWFLSFGIGGNSPLHGRHQDTFGVGWYYVASSDQIGPLLEAVLGPIGDGQGVELFYNVELTPYCHVTPDLQVIVPARDDFDTALVAGLRMKIDF